MLKHTLRKKKKEIEKKSKIYHYGGGKSYLKLHKRNLEKKNSFNYNTGRGESYQKCETTLLRIVQIIRRLNVI